MTDRDNRVPPSLEDVGIGAERPGKRFPTVGIGTSAGGVHALQMFFESLPDDVDAAFVVVVHLDPGHQSELSNILAARTRMPVAQVLGRVKLEPRHVYVITPNRQLLVTDQHLAIAEFDEPRWQRAPIDLFFRSLAAQRGDDFAIIFRARVPTGRSASRRSRRRAASFWSRIRKRLNTDPCRAAPSQRDSRTSSCR